MPGSVIYRRDNAVHRNPGTFGARLEVLLKPYSQEMDMQPNPPSAPNPAAPPPVFRWPGLIVGLIALFAFVYLVDHASKGEAAVFGGVDRHIAEPDFHSAQCTAVFGGCKIDLRDAQIEGSEAVLETYAIFGGVEIRVPEDWEVVSRNVAIFGGVSDQRRRPPSGARHEDSDPRRGGYFRRGYGQRLISPKRRLPVRLRDFPIRPREFPARCGARSPDR